MRKNLRLFNGMAATLFCTLALVACGGGGGGSDSGGGGETSIPYNGLTTQAKIDQTNAEMLSLEVLEGDDLAAGFGDLNPPAMALAANPPQAVPAYRLPGLANTMMGILVTLKPRAALPVSIAAMSPTIPVDNDGPCGGKITGTLSVDDETFGFYFSGKFTDYDACDDAGGVLSGSVKMRVEYDATDTETTTLEFVPLHLVSVYEDLSISGSIKIVSLGTNSEKVTTNMVIRDNAQGKTFKIANFEVNVTDTGMETIEDIISGRFYNPEYGYVDISTPVPLVTNFGYDHPSAGELLCTGSNNSQITVTFGPTSAVGTGTDALGGAIYFEYTYPAP